MLSGRVASDDKRREYLQIIVSESERLTALIENVLDFAKVERGKSAYEFHEGDVGQVVARAVDVYRYRAEREGVEVEVSVDPEASRRRCSTSARSSSCSSTCSTTRSSTRKRASA